MFAVLADPTTHAAIDGTGWVQEPIDRAALTEVARIFRMDMSLPNVGTRARTPALSGPGLRDHPVVRRVGADVRGAVST